ncbi:MAG: antitoxin VbhA family protein [Eubacteriales bacterium]|nr:antitoxin VbhA family protein [Eubacteriales bacterium]MDD3350259.1 antitoxin VbhA family protein [Eubacteriales bacterium]
MKKKISEEKITHVIRSATASLAFEGMKPSREAEYLGRRYLESDISSSEALARIKAMHACSFGR